MKRQILIVMMVLVLMATLVTSGWAEEWAIKADATESCCCNPACPCVFGSPPTLGHCDTVGLVEIKGGHYGEVRLDGISVVYTGRMGKWVKYSVSENASDRQVKAAAKLVEVFYGIPGMEILSVEKVPISIERNADKIKFSVPSSTAEIEMMKGFDGGPIKIQNISAQGTVTPHHIDYTQYKSITLSHDSKDKKFSYSGTNGLTARWDAVSKK